MADEIAIHDDVIDPALAALLERAGPAGRKPAPVERWNPLGCGEIGLRIAADGTWFYQGSPIGREGLVRLFASVLRREADGRFVLVTPVEKVAVAVDDAPFLAVEMHAAGSGPGRRLTFRTNVGDVVVAGPDHALRFGIEPDGAVRPYLHVRRGLEAKLTRAVAHELLDLIEEGVHDDDARWWGIWSDGAFFPLMPADSD